LYKVGKITIYFCDVFHKIKITRILMTLQQSIVLSLSLSLLTPSLTHAQDYRTALGLRVGAANFVSLKHFFSPAAASEVFAGYRYWTERGAWFNVVGLYQHHFSIEGAPGLKWYVGGGASVLLWDDKPNNLPVGNAQTSLSLLGVVGLDFKFSKAPINASIDWAPGISLGPGRPHSGSGYGAIALRYTFK
jgi:hypothetical protein